MLDEIFARLVAEEVKNKVSTEQTEFLRLPENWTRWQRCLTTLVENLQSQIDDITSQEETITTKYRLMGDEGLRLLAEVLSEFESRRKKIVRFKFHVEARLDEVARMIALGSDAIDERLKTVDFLRRAIHQHRTLVLEYEFEPSPIDNALWAATEGKWDFDNITADDLA
jgi:DNA-directed RNA polymerase specialized sigma subunit